MTLWILWQVPLYAQTKGLVSGPQVALSASCPATPLRGCGPQLVQPAEMCLEVPIYLLFYDRARNGIGHAHIDMALLTVLPLESSPWRPHHVTCCYSS